MKFRANQLNKLLFPEIIYKGPENEKKIYLTFDDGPTPVITSQVLAFLLKYKVKATFFCRGDHVIEYQDIYQRIIEEGHVTGNHGYSHLHGWYTSTEKYVSDCQKAAGIIKNPIFRPPYGKITPGEYNLLMKEFTIYLWSSLSWDFHPWVNPKMCYWHTARQIFPGSIIVFHDTQKASKKLIYTLPRIIELAIKKGFEFATLPV